MQATIDMEMEAKHMELKKEKDLLGRRHMDRDNALRKVRLFAMGLSLLVSLHIACQSAFTFGSQTMLDLLASFESPFLVCDALLCCCHVLVNSQ